MGLPLYRDPDDEQVVEETTAKLDRAAATRRSSIRRESSVRPRDNITASQSLARLIRDRRRASSRSQDRNDSRIARLQAELEALRRVRLNISDTLERDSSRATRDANVNDEFDSFIDDENRDSSASGSIEPADVVRSHLPRPSNLRFEVSQSANSAPSSRWRFGSISGGAIPSPPYSSSSERRDRSIPDGPILEDNLMPALTEGFAPAHSNSATPYVPGREGATSDESQLETPPPETWEASYPPLRRVGHLSPRALPGVDGLGDRRRSPSPLSDSHEEESWTTLLTEMNTERANMSTSFASAASTTQTIAHEDFISSRSQSATGRRSQNSQNTSTSFGEIGSGEETCELDLPPGITEEDVRVMRARHRPRRNREQMTGRRGLQEHRDRERSFNIDFDGHDGPNVHDHSYGHEDDHRLSGRVEVSMLRAILERLHRREDIPEDWWATVGLPSDFGRTFS